MTVQWQRITSIAPTGKDDMDTKVIDLAKWNPVKSYAALKSDGINYLILKAINKSNKADSLFATHYSGATAAGIKVLATYHYSYATSVAMAVASANAWITQAKGRCTKFYLDWEDASLPKDHTAITIINKYAEIIKAAGGDFGIYCGLSWYNSYLKKYASELPYDFWIARYPKSVVMQDEDDPDMSKKPSIANNLDGWQYTSMCQVDGISSKVDCSIWYESMNNTSSDTPNVIAVCPYKEPKATVKPGMNGESVKWVQWYCYKFGVLVNSKGILSEANIDGDFGALTESAVKEAQKRLGFKGIYVDGVVGKLTRARFKKVQI